MPELPEVETIVKEMQAAHLVGLCITKAMVYWDRSIARLSSKDFCKKIVNQIIEAVSRRGKFLVFSLTTETLLVHLRMTGKFFIDDKRSSPHSHERIRLFLSDGRILRFEDQRKFGKWYLSETDVILKKIGIEPLSKQFTLKAFKKLLAGRKRQIKPFLLDQKYIAGLGNIYADEALWAAKIHPARLINTLRSNDIVHLHQAIIAVLKSGVKNTGTSLGSARANYYSVSGRRGKNQELLKVFRCDGMPCPRCQTTIQKIRLGQRGTHFCPVCQLLT